MSWLMVHVIAIPAAFYLGRLSTRVTVVRLRRKKNKDAFDSLS
jgi:hypothetical protein